MKVFISSVINGYDHFRTAAEEAIRALGHEVIRAEDFGASSNSPRVACLDGVRQSDVVVLLLGKSYGVAQDFGLSATHEEFREAKGQKELLAFVEDVADREAAQDEFVREVQDWSGGVFTEFFGTAAALRQAVTRLLHQREVEDARGGADIGEMTSRCLSLLPDDDHGFRSSQSSLIVALAPGPR